MNVILILIPMALGIVIIAGIVFFWAVKSEQFEDLDRQGSNILFDDDIDNLPSDECGSHHATDKPQS